MTSTPHPTPDGIDETSALAFGAIFQALIRVGASRQDAERYAFAAQLELALPARDARIRAETLRWAAGEWDKRAERAAELPTANLGQSWQRYQLTESLLAVAEWCRSQATAVENGAVLSAESVAAASAVPTEGSGHPRLAEYAHPVAEGRCESCGDPVVYNLAVDYVAHKDADESMTCTKPWPAIPPRLSLDTPEGDTAPDRPEWMAMGDGWTLCPRPEGEVPMPTTAVAVAYRNGLAAGRTAAAEAIRDARYPDPSPCIPAWHAGYTEAWERAARVAENGAAT